MSTVYADSNIIIRFLIEDDPDKANSVLDFLKNNNVILPDLIVAEIFYVLKSNYKVKKSKICDQITDLLRNDHVKCNKDLLIKTLERLKKGNIDFPDAYLATLSEIDNKQVLSYDKDLDSADRIEP